MNGDSADADPGLRLNDLLQVGLELTARPEPEALLQQLRDSASRVVPADQVGVAMLDSDADLAAAGGLIRDSGTRPLRLSAAPDRLDATLLPTGLPATGSLLSVPLAHAGHHHGWLYFARSPALPPFSRLDKQLAMILAASVSTMYENALLYREAKRHAEALEIEVGQRQRSEAALRRLTRVHEMRSRIAAEIVRTRSQQQLFDEVCRTAVEQGGYRMAWIGVQQGELVEPVASHGLDHGYVDLVRNAQQAGFHDGPAMTALRERRPLRCNDIASDPRMAPWRGPALERGFQSLVVLPLFARATLAGCLALYADEPDFFSDEDLSLLVELASDISHALEFIAKDEQLDFLSYYDPLTGLANRRLFHERLAQHVLAAHQNNGRFAVLLVDLEQFKAVNDTLGLQGGDEVLKSVAERLTRVAGNPGYLARVGGDRFAALIPELKDPGSLSAMLRDKVWTRLSRPITVAGHTLRLSGKVGLALFPEDGDDAESLFRNAEAALKRAKQTGERFLFYTAQMGAAMKQKLELEAQLRHALLAEEFVLYYQPKIDLQGGKICGAEALIRWNSPELGLVPPAQFIPLLEENGLIVEVGRWALEQAAADRSRWLREGIAAPRISVNISAVQLRDPEFLDCVCQTLRRFPENAGGLELELTESSVIANAETSLATLQRLREIGVDLALDDFGTGYSSLSYLSKLPLSTVKIDRSFVQRMGDNADSISIVSTIISLAQSMGLRVVAEGVDSMEQLKFLRLLHCDEMQGFLFSPALPPEEFAALLRKGRTMALE